MTRSARMALLLAGMCAFETFPQQASADDPAITRPAAGAPAEDERWYGWETLSLDGAAAAMMIAGFGAHTLGSNLVGLAGFGTYALGAPIVHLARGHYWRSAISLGARLALPIIGFFMGAFLAMPAPSNNVSLPLEDGFLGAGIGMMAAVPIDAVVLGWDVPAPDGAPPPRVAPVSGVAALTPRLAVVRGAEGRESVALSVGATF